MEMTDYLAGFNQQQTAAVTFPLDLPLLVLAGAGTGKTRVLATRFVHMLATDPLCEPENILTLTFTEKAAAEMRQRILQLCQEAGVVDSPLAFQDAWIGTFHSFCHRLLQQHSVAAGLDPGFAVCDQPKSRLIYRQVVEKYFTKPGAVPLPGVLAVADLRFYENDVYQLVGRLKDSFIYPEEFFRAAEQGRENYTRRIQLLQADLPDLDLPQQTKTSLWKHLAGTTGQLLWEKELAKIIYDLFSGYQQALAEKNLVDFSDLIYYTYRLLAENHQLLLRWRENFRYILVDEFQDTNQAQFTLLRLLARDARMSNVTVVGDEKQAIYAWRNARPENIKEFAAREWGGGEIALSVNYRSYQEILDVAHCSITREPYFAPREKGAELVAARSFATDTCLKLYLAANPEEESRALAQAIKGLIQQGVAPQDIVLLLRSPRWAKPYEDALREIGVPYRTIGGIGFYDREEIKDLLAYLRIIYNPYDHLALMRVLQGPPCFCTDAELYQLSLFTEQEGKGAEKSIFFYDTLLSKGRQSTSQSALTEKIRKLLLFLEEMRRFQAALPLREFIEKILDASGYLQFIYSKDPAEILRRVANIKKLLTLAEDFATEEQPVVLEDFITYTNFFLDQGLQEGEGELAPEEVVYIMSVHQAKGLEYPHVFLANLKHCSFPMSTRYSKLEFSRTDGLVMKHDQFGNTCFKFHPHNYERDKYRHLYQQYGLVSYKLRQRAEQQQEERRLFYVALTRAQKQLYLSCPAPFPTKPRGEHYFQELWTGFAGTEPWLERINCPEANISLHGEGIPDHWGQDELEKYYHGLATWYQKRQQVPKNLIYPQPNVSLSATQMEAYLCCPRSHFLRYQLKLAARQAVGQEFGERDYDALLLGQLLHKTIEAYHREACHPEAVHELLHRQAKALGIDKAQYEGALGDMARVCWQNYLTGPLARLDPEPFALEQEFAFPIQDNELEIELRGKIDRIDRDPAGKWLLVDYKTNRRITASQLAEYSRQLRFYSLAFQELYPECGEPVLAIYHLPLGKLIPVAGSSEHLATVRNLLVKTAKAIAAGYFPAKPGTHCNWCNYRSYCE
jgi:DNA helicase-2/ATP-dependent DNA helicase PcrA